MEQTVFRLMLTDEAVIFLRSLSERARTKIYYNIQRVAKGEKNKELFKKTGEY